MSIDFKKYVSGAAIPHIYFKDYKTEPFLWMPIKEQKELVAMIDDAFESIKRAKSNAEQNLKNAKELFDSYLKNIFMFFHRKTIIFMFFYEKNIKYFLAINKTFYVYMRIL